MRIADYVADLRYEDLPPEVIDRSKLILRDGIGNQIAASAISEPARRMVELMAGWGGAAECTVVGYGTRLPAPNAVMCNDLAGLAQITHAVPHRIVADEAVQGLPELMQVAWRRMADMVSIKFGKCGDIYKAMQMIRIAEAANLPVRVDWTQGSRLLDTATGHLHAAIRLVGCDPGMDYHLRIEDEPVAEGGAQVENGQVVMPTGPGLGLVVDEALVERLSQRV